MDAKVRARKERSLEVARYWLGKAEGAMVEYWDRVVRYLERELCDGEG